MPQIFDRDAVWDGISGPWDVLIVGGGIVGAGILREAAHEGLRALLVEAGDFASGTSSRSSKMVHGGLRYLNTGQVMLTVHSVRERQRLLKEGRGLIDPLKILLPEFKSDMPPGWVIGIGLAVYDAIAGKWQHGHLSAAAVEKICPFVAHEGLEGGYRFFDAQTDDARLVLRVIQEGVRAGGRAIHYARVEGLLRGQDKRVCGVRIRDQVSGRTAEARAAVVINATGAWADDLRAQVGQKPRLRRLRGSHLFFPREKLPLDRQITFQHPSDRRYILIFPWEGVTLVGNTDMDYRAEMETDPQCTGTEVEYLMAAVSKAFPSLGLTVRDVRSKQTGIRSVLDTGKSNPSKELRDEVLWDEDGLVTICGGKLTMYRHMAAQTLNFIRRRLPGRPRIERRARALDELEYGDFTSLAETAGLGVPQQVRLLGRYGHAAPDLLRAAREGELQPIAGVPTLWAELRWAARAEGVIHLDDLLLRRTRLGLTLPGGAAAEMDRIRSTCQEELGWDDLRWRNEADAYLALWRRAYAPPGD